MTIKTLIYKLIIVLLPTAILIICFEQSAKRISTSYSIKHHNLVAKKDIIDTLILGSSHANAGINPEYMGENVYNISNTSQSLYYDYHILLKYLKICPNVKTVVLPISYFTLFSPDLDKSIEYWRCDFYSAILHIRRPGSSVFDIKQFSYVALMDGPLKILAEHKNSAKLDINEFGYQKFARPANISAVINDKEGRARVALHEKYMDRKFVTNNIGYIEKIHDLLKTNDIKLVFITTPVYKTYYNFMMSEYYDDMIHMTAILSRKYNSKHYNYLHDNRFRLDDFRDNDHLNEAGARKFSLILKGDLEKQDVL